MSIDYLIGKMEGIVEVYHQVGSERFNRMNVDETLESLHHDIEVYFREQE